MKATQRVALGVVLAGTALAWLWTGGGTLERTGADAEAAAPRVEAAPASLPSGADVATVERTLLAESHPSRPVEPGARAARPTEFEPFATIARTVDELGSTVPFATVRVWPERPEKQPLLQSLTDAEGRCTLRIDRELCLLQASKDGTTDSGNVRLWHELARRSPEQVLVLQRLVPLTVLVLHADRTPAAGARVAIRSNGWVGAVEPQAPEPQTTDAAGRCHFLVNQSQSLALCASEGSAATLSESVLTLGAEAIDVVLRFPGALTIAGRLVAADGQPVVGEIDVEELTSEQQRVDRVLRDGALAMERRSTVSDATGGWHLDLPHSGTFEVVGSALGHASSPVARIDVSDSDPHPTVELRLLAPAAIRGTVVHADGTPFAGGNVRIEPEGEAGARGLGSGRTANVDEQGKFAFVGAHPHATYALTCTPDLKRRAAKVIKKGVVPGGPELRIVIRDEDLETGRIVGTVVSAVTGKPVTAFRQRLVLYRDGKCVGLHGEDAIQSATGAFGSEELTRGETYALAIAGDGLAPALAGPITITQREHRFEVRLEEPGQVSIRVLEPGGAPARQAQAGIDTREQAVPQTRWIAPRRTDDLGVARFDKLAPGRYAVTASRLGQHTSTACEVRSGLTTEVQIMLPR